MFVCVCLLAVIERRRGNFSFGFQSNQLQLGQNTWLHPHPYLENSISLVLIPISQMQHCRSEVNKTSQPCPAPMRRSSWPTQATLFSSWGRRSYQAQYSISVLSQQHRLRTTLAHIFSHVANKSDGKVLLPLYFSVVVFTCIAPGSA